MSIIEHYKLYVVRKAGLFIFFVIFIINSYSQAPDWEWAKSIHTGGKEYSHDVVADPSTNEVYLVGQWENSLSSFFPTGAQPSTDFSSPYGNIDAFVAKYDKDGTLIWAFKVGGPGDDFIDEIVLDPSGNIYITGYLGSGTNPAYFSGMSPHTGSSTLTNIDREDFFVAKYNSDGEFQWVKRSVTDTDHVRGLDLHATSSAIFVTGQYNSACDIGSFSITQTFGGIDLFLIKFDHSGNEQWLIYGGSDGDDFANAVVADELDVYFSGNFKGDQLDLKTISGSDAATLPTANNGKEEIFLVSYDINGVYNWGQTISSTEEGFCYDLVMNSDSLFLTGGIDSPTLFPAYSENPVNTSSHVDIFVSSHAKINGNTGWVNTIPCTDGGDQYGYSLAINSQDEILLTGFFDKDLNFPDATTLTSAGSKDVFIAKYSSSGTFIWAEKAGSSGGDMGYGISAGTYGSVYISGLYDKLADFGLLTLPDDGGDNLFLAKLQEPCTDAIGGTVSAPLTEICEGESVTLTLTGYSGDIQWQRSPPGDNPWNNIPGETNPVLTISPVAETVEYRAYLTAGSCNPDSSNTITITSYEVPVSNPGPGGETCGLVFALQAIPSVGNGQWTQTSGPGTTIFSPTDDNPIVTATVTQFGTYEFTWTETNGICVDDSTITVVYTESPSSEAGANAEICISDGTYSITGSTSSNGTILWSTSGDGTFSDPAIDNPVYTIGTETGSVTLTKTVTSPGSCADAVDFMILTLTPEPASDAGPDAEICISDGTYSITGSTSSNGTILWSTSGDGTFSDPAIDNPVYTIGTETGSVTLTKTVSSPGSCADAVDFMTLTLTPLPASDAGTDDEICISDGSYSITGSTSSNGTILWSTSGNGTYSDPAIDNPVYTLGSETGSVTLTKTVSSPGSCADAVDFMTLTLTPLPASDAGTGDEICISDGTYSITGSTSSNGTILWSTSGDGTFSDPAIDNPVYTIGTETGSVTLTKTVTSPGSCADAVDFMILTLTPEPASDAGPDAEICISDGTYSITGSTSSNGSVLWSTSGDGTFSDPAIDNPVYTIGTETGSVTLTKTVSSPGSCADAVDFMTLTLTPIPSSDAGTDDEICISDGTYSITGSTSSNGSILWTTSGDGTFSDPAIDNPVYTIGTETGSVTLTKTVSSPGSCADAVDFMTLTLTPLPTSDVMAADEICISDASYSITGSTSSNGSILWTTSGDGTFSDPAIDNPEYTIGTETGSVTLTKTVSSPGSCADAVDFMILTLTPEPASDAGPDAEICISDGSYPITGTTSANGSILWTSSGDGAFSDPAIDNPVYTIGTETGSVTLTKTVSSPGSCADAVDFITLTLSQVPISDAGVGGEVCDLDYVLRATPSAGTGTWTMILGSGSATFAPDVNSPLATVSVSEYGNKKFVWTEVNGSCYDADTISVSFYEQPTVDAGSGGIVCDLHYNLGATLSTGMGKWVKSSGPGTATFSPSDTDPLATLTVSEYGSYEITWIEQNGPCSPSMTITILFLEQPVADAGIGGEECDMDFQLQATPSVGSGTWSVTSGPGIATFDPSNMDPLATVTVSAFGTYEFTWTETNGICSDSNPISVTFFEPPVAYASAPEEVCGYTAELSATLSSGSGIWSLESGPGNAIFINPTNIGSNEITVDEYGTYTFTWTEINGPCSNYITIAINFLETPMPDAGNDAESCGLTYEMQATGGPGQGTWMLATGLAGSAFSPSETDPKAIVTVPDYGKYEFIWHVTNSICIGEDVVSITFYETPIADAGPNQVLDYKFSTSMNAIEPAVGTGTWEPDPDNIQISNLNDPGAEVMNLEIGDNNFMWRVVNGTCPASIDEVLIRVNDIVTPTVITPNEDGLNDELVFPGLEDQQGSELTIYNRWGTEIYRNSDYRNDWKGRDHKDRELQSDTYYYILKISNGRIIKGFIEIRR